MHPDVHFEQLGPIDSNTSTLANNLSWEDEIFKNLLVDASESSGTGAFLLDAGSASGLAQHAALSDKHDVTVGEFLFELTGQSTHQVSFNIQYGMTVK